MSVRDDPVLFLRGGKAASAGGAAVGGGAAVTTTRPHKLDAAEHQAADDTTRLDASTDRHGLLPKLSGVATDVLLGNGTFGPEPVVAAHAAAADPHTGYQRESEKGVASGYAPLDSGVLVPVAYLGNGTPDGTKFLRDDGTWAAPPAGGSALTVADEGTPLATAVATLDFVGAGVVASGAGATKTITISGGGSGVTVEEVDGTPTVTATKLVLPNGTLGVVGSVATYTPAAGGGGDLTFIAETILGSAAATISVSGISGAYRDLVIVFRLRGTDGGAGIGASLRMGNGTVDSGTNYAYFYTYAGWTAGNGSGTSSASPTLCAIPNSGAAAGDFGYCRIEILNYADTSRYRGWTGEAFSFDGSGVLKTTSAGNWKNAANAIDIVQATASAGNFAIGSAMTVYGRG